MGKIGGINLSLLDDLINAFVNLEENKVLNLINKLLEEGKDPVEILEACRKATIDIGKKI